MPIDIISFRDKYKKFYGDMSLDDVAKDMYQRGGFNKQTDFDSWKQSAGIEPVLDEDRRRRNPTFEDKLRMATDTVAPKEGTVVGALAKTLTRVPENIIASGITAIQGGSGASVTDRGLGDRFVNWVDKRNKELSGEYKGTGDLIPGLISKQDVAELGQNLGFSGVSMAATVAGRVAGSVMGSVVPIAGTVSGGFAGGLAGGYMAASRMQSYQQMNEWLNQKNEESIKLYGRPINPEEEEKFKNTFLSLAEKSGFWEGAPESVGNVADLAIIMAKATPAGKAIPASLLKKLGIFAAKLGGIIATEEATETVTQMGQHNVNVEAGFGDKKREWTSPEDWLTSAKEVLPQVLLLSTFLGGAGHVINRIQEARTPREENEIIERLKAGAITADFINTGLKTGEFEGKPFTPQDALDMIGRAQEVGIFDTDDLDRFKDKYPALRDGINGLIAENLTKKVDEVVTQKAAEDL